MYWPIPTCQQNSTCLWLKMWVKMWFLLKMWVGLYFTTWIFRHVTRLTWLLGEWKKGSTGKRLFVRHATLEAIFFGQASSMFRNRALVPSRAVRTQNPSKGSRAAGTISGCLDTVYRPRSEQAEQCPLISDPLGQNPPLSFFASLHEYVNQVL